MAVAVLAASLVPAIEALQTGLAATAGREELLGDHYQLERTLESLLAEPFASLATAAGDPGVASSYSASPVRVYIARFDALDSDGDGDPFSNPADDLLWVRVESEVSGRALETLTNR